MDRPGPRSPDRHAAVRTDRFAAFDLLLPAVAGERGEPASAPAARRTVHGVALLWQPPDGRHAGGESRAGTAADGHSRYRGVVSQAETEPPGARSPDLPLPVARCADHSPQSGLEHRYYLHSDAERLSVSGRRHGLVQPLRAQLGALQYDGDQLLSGRPAGRVPLRPARDLEQRPGLAVYRRRFSGPAQKARHLDQHGWPRPRPRQRIYRALVEIAEVRTHLSRRLRRRSGAVYGVATLLPLLQLRPSASGPRLQNARRSVSAQVNKEEGLVKMGALPPNPRDLAQLLPEWMILLLLYPKLPYNGKA